MFVHIDNDLLMVHDPTVMQLAWQLMVTLHQGPSLKKFQNCAILLVRSTILNPRNLYQAPGPRYEKNKQRQRALISSQILAVLNSRKYSSQYEKPIFKLNSNIEYERKVPLRGVFWTRSLLDMDSNINPLSISYALSMIHNLLTKLLSS